MDIRKLKNSLKKFQELSLGELALVMQEKVEDIEPVLVEWEARGKITKTTQISFCGGACSCSAEKLSNCDTAPKIIYRWVS